MATVAEAVPQSAAAAGPMNVSPRACFSAVFKHTALIFQHQQASGPIFDPLAPLPAIFEPSSTRFSQFRASNTCLLASAQIVSRFQPHHLFLSNQRLFPSDHY